MLWLTRRMKRKKAICASQVKRKFFPIRLIGTPPAQSQIVAYGLWCIYNVDTQRENVMEAVIRKWGNSPCIAPAKRSHEVGRIRLGAARHHHVNERSNRHRARYPA